MSTNLPAARPDVDPRDATDRPRVAPQRPVSVAFLPLGIVTFIILAFVMAAWTFLSAAV